MISPTALLWVFIGGGLGASLRFAISILLTNKPDLENSLESGFLHSFPWAILLVNVLGSLLIGIFAQIVSRETFSEYAFLSPLLIAGLLGGFTTFSAFSLDTVMLVQSGRVATALAYVICSVVFSVLAAYVGYIIAK